jgi:hypothetical protein
MDIDIILKEISDASKEIPFANSQFQMDNFIVNAEITTGRAYRKVLLQINDRLSALNEAKYNLAKEDIDIEELQEKIKNPDSNKFDIRRWDLEINRKIELRQGIMKLVNDAIYDVTHLYQIFSKMPKYTREQFEAEEKEHFEISLQRQALKIEGASSSLLDMGSDFIKVPDNLTEKLIPKLVTDKLNDRLLDE